MSHTLREILPDMDTQTKQRSVALDGLGSMIEDRQRYEEASALCLLSIARSQERIADALETLVSVVPRDSYGQPYVRIGGIVGIDQP
jgi:hypothetical protein